MPEKPTGAHSILFWSLSLSSSKKTTKSNSNHYERLHFYLGLNERNYSIKRSVKDATTPIQQTRRVTMVTAPAGCFVVRQNSFTDDQATRLYMSARFQRLKRTYMCIITRRLEKRNSAFSTYRVQPFLSVKHHEDFFTVFSLCGSLWWNSFMLDRTNPNSLPFGDSNPSKQTQNTVFQALCFSIKVVKGVFQIVRLVLNGEIISSIKNVTACGCCVGGEAESQLGPLTALRVLAWRWNSSMVDRATQSAIWLHVQKANQPKQGG